MWGYPYKTANKRIKWSMHPPYRGISVITPLPFGGGEGGGAAIFMNLCVFCSSVFFCEKKNAPSWERERTLHVRKNAWDSLGSFFSHRAHRVNRAFLRTFRAHRGPSAYRKHRALLLSLGWKMWELRRSRMVKNPYNTPSWPPSTHADVIAYNREYNPQEISV